MDIPAATETYYGDREDKSNQIQTEYEPYGDQYRKGEQETVNLELKSVNRKIGRQECPTPTIYI